MIPLMQQFMGWPGTVPPPAVPVLAEADTEAFTLLMDQPIEVPPEGAEMMAMMAPLPTPQAAVPEIAGEAALLKTAEATLDAAKPEQLVTHAIELPKGSEPMRQRDVAMAPISFPTALDPTSREVGPASIVSPDVVSPQNAALPAQPVPQSAVTEPQHLTAAPISRRSALAPIKAEVVLKAPKAALAATAPAMAQANVGENAFLARIEPKAVSQLISAAPLIDAKSTALASVAVQATAAIVVPSPKLPTVPKREDDAKPEKVSQIMTAPTAVVPVAPATTLDSNGGENTLLPAVADVTFDAMARPEPQISNASGAERSVGSPSATLTTLPQSVPAALVAHAPGAKNGPVEFVLNPEELGKIRFEIHQHGDQVKVVLAVERPETLDLLRRHADQLIQEFRAAGFSGTSLGFGHWGGQQGNDPPKVTVFEPDKPATELSLTMRAAPQNQNFAPSQGLNLRL